MPRRNNNRSVKRRNQPDKIQHEEYTDIEPIKKPQVPPKKTGGKVYKPSDKRMY